MTTDRALIVIGILVSAAAAYYARGPFLWLREERRKKKESEERWAVLHSQLADLGVDGQWLAVTEADHDAVQIGVDSGQIEVFYRDMKPPERCIRFVPWNRR